MWSSARKSALPRSWHGGHARRQPVGAAVARERGVSVADAMAARGELRVRESMVGRVAPTVPAAAVAAGARGADRG